MKKFLVVATAMVAGLALGLAQAADEKGKGKGDGKGKGGDPAKRAEMMIKKLDTDGNGTISKKEFAAGPMAEKAKGKEGALDKIFAARDTNKDGELDKKELSAPRKGGKGGPPKGKGDDKKKDDKKKDDKKKAE